MGKLTGKQWLSDFDKQIKSALCRVQGKDVSLEDGFGAIEHLLDDIKKRDAAVWWVGNGGSSSLCSHFSQDLLNKMKIRSLALSDASLLTCMANDYGYPAVYARPLEVLVKKGDLLIAISSGGRSENILASVRLAQAKGLRLLTLSGMKADNPLWAIPADVSFYFPSQLYGQVEMGHGVLLHAALESVYLSDGSKPSS